MKARARAIREYGSEMKGGSEVEIREFKDLLHQGKDSWIRYDLVKGRFFYISFHSNERTGGNVGVWHVLNRDGTLGAVIYDGRRS